MSASDRLQGLFAVLRDLLFPRRAVCAGCGSIFGCDRDDICDACRHQLAKNWVGVRPPEKGMLLDGAAFAHRYDSAAAGVVRSFKYSFDWVLADEMGADTARAAKLLRINELDLVTAVPMHPRRMRVRGRNHSEVLARALARRLEAPYENVLMRTRNAPQQARLSREARRHNLQGGFAAVPESADKLRGKTILLVDDVWTTGSTAASCARALHDAGAKRIYFVAYAYGERKNHGKD